MSFSVANRYRPGHEQNMSAVVFAAPGAGQDHRLKALFFGVIMALALFAGGAVATNQDSPLGILAPDSAAACGFATFNAKLDDSNSNDGSDTDYSASGAANGYGGTQVRVFITAATASGGGQWCNTYKYNALSENSTSATQWTYMGTDTGNTTGGCDYIANSRTSHRGYFFRGTGANCGVNVWAVSYDPPSYGEGNNGGWIRNLSCTTYAAPYSSWSTTGSAQKPHAGCQGTTVGFEPNAMASGIFIDTVAPTAPTWTESSATSHKSGNTLYFRKVAATISITLTHTETLTSTKSGGQSFTWTAPSVTTGWSGYFTGDAASTTTSTKTLTSSTTSANGNLVVDSNDRSDNDGSNLTIALTADATAPTLTWTAPSTNDQQAASSYNFTWTNADTGSGVASRTVQKQTAPVSGGNCGTFTNSGSATSNATTSFSYTGMVTSTCYRIVVATTDNVGNVASSTSPSILVDTNAPTATISVDAANTDTYRDGNTVYYRGGTAGNVNITVSGSDAVSGFQDQRFNAMGGTTTGWSPTAASSYTTTNPYTLNYAWGSTSTGSATLSGNVRNNAGLTANTTTLTLTRDSTAPGLGFNYPAGPTIYTPDASFTVDFNITEAGSGFDRAGAGWSLQRQRATVSNNVCGSYANDGSPVTGKTDGLDQTSEETGLEPGYCYKWELSATDSVGNTASFSTVTTVIVDETDPTEPVLSTTSTGAYVSGGTVFVNTSAGGTLALTATSSDPETGITTLNFGAVTTDGGWSPITSANVAATASAATKTYTWTTGASAADLTVSASNNAGVTSAPLGVTFEPDNSNPMVTPIGRYRGPLLAANPLTYWRLGEASDTTATDIGSAAVDGTYTNGVTLGASGLLLNDSDKAATFDGVDDWVSVPAMPAISGAITLSGWVSTADNKNEYVLARGSQAYIRRVTSLNRFVFSWLDSGAVQRTLNSAVDAAPADGQTHFVVATHDGSTASIYVDGVLSNSISGQSLQTIPSGTWGIGSNNTGSADLWNGKIDDVAIFDQALSASVIKSLYAYGSSSIQASANYDVAWTGEDEQSGILSYSVQRQRGPVVTAGTCAGVTYSNDGSATVTSNETLSGSGLSDGYCYRWAITATDYVGHTSSTATSAVILIDTTAPTATITYSHANSATESPFVRGDLTITATFDEPVAAAPLLTIERNGSDVVTDQAMTATGNPLAYTYLYTIDDDGDYDLFLAAADVVGNNTSATVVDSFEVIQQEQTITFAALADKTYGDADFTVSATASSGLTVEFAASGDCSIDVDLVTVTGAGDCTVTASQDGNDEYLAAPDVDRTFNIDKATLTVTADDDTRAYGASDPAFSATITDFVNGEDLNTSGVTGTASFNTNATAASGVGTYTITPSTGSLAADNYDFTFAPGDLTITARPITATAAAKAKVYGDADPALTYSVTSGSLVNGDTFAGSLTRVAGESIGTYAINVGSLSLSANYDLTYQSALLTISQRPLTVNVDNKSRPYGQANPTLTGSITGAASGDTITATYSTTATPASPAGTYPITATASSTPANVIDNYTVTINPGTLTVGKSDQTITFGALANKTYGDPQFTISATASSGLAVSFNASGDCGVSMINKVTITGAGSCTITATQAGNADWNAAPSVPQTFTIAKATPVITWAAPAPIQYGTVLNGGQLNATTTTTGTFTYTPPAGTLLEAGTHTLSVTFVPTNTDDYNGNNKSVSIDVTLASPPVESGLRNWTFEDDIARFDNGAVVVTDPTAPSGDDHVLKLSSTSGQKTAASEHVTVIPGDEVRVWGDWRLSGHGTRLRLCFDVGGCTSSATVGSLTGSTVYSIDWITFELATNAPANSTEAWLEWTVGSDSYSDGFSWSVLADDDTSNTIVDVNALITVNAPAMVDFGVGLPTDVLDQSFSVNVITNNETGYDLEVTGTDMNGPSEDITINSMSISANGGPYNAFAGEGTALPVGSESVSTSEAGVDHPVAARLTLPFVGSGLYQGTLVFTATTN